MAKVLNIGRLPEFRQLQNSCCQSLLYFVSQYFGSFLKLAFCLKTAEHHHEKSHRQEGSCSSALIELVFGNETSEGIPSDLENQVFLSHIISVSSF